MALVLGIDTSNYTTSCAVYDTDTNSVIQRKQLLPVKSGECGIRQSDAVFHHTKQLPPLMESLFDECKCRVDAVSVSVTPRRCEGSYMPCFTVGEGVARSLSAATDVPLFINSHQEGHIAAALYSADKLDLIGNKFLAFHVSGGTTEGMIVTHDKCNIISCELVSQTSDLNAGQLIDRVGVAMGLAFPAGREMEKLAAAYKGKIKRHPVCVREGRCSLSGAENIALGIYRDTADMEATAAFVFDFVCRTLLAMTDFMAERYGKTRVLYAGGVMSNNLMRARLSQNAEAYFAAPEFSADNAAGTALLAYRKFKKD